MGEKQSSRAPWGKEVVVAHDNKDSLVSQGLRQDAVGKAQSMQEESHEAKEEIEKETEEKEAAAAAMGDDFWFSQYLLS